MSKYSPLAAHLEGTGRDSVPMTFAEIERVIRASLPRSAYRHRSWWANNPADRPQIQGWRDAGYKLARVDMTGRRAVFEKIAPPAAEGPEPVEAGGAFSRVYGCMKGTVTVAPGVDLTAPLDVEWDAMR